MKIVAFVIACLFGFLSVEAYVLPDFWMPPMELNISLGARRDELKSNVLTFIPENTAPLHFDNIRIDDIKLVEMGLKVTVALGDEEYPFYHWWLNQFYLRGSAYVGKTFDNAKWREEINNIPSTLSPFIMSGHAKVHSRDYDFAIGWHYPVDDNLSIAPLVGYYNHRLSFSVHDLKNPPGGRDSTPRQFDETEFISTFEGPWLGVDVTYAWEYWSLMAEYAYCFVFWSASYNAPFNISNTFTDKRESSDGMGNRFYLRLENTYWECWTIGLAVYYRDFSCDDGSRTPVQGFINPNEFDSAKARWHSFGTQLDIGFYF